MIVPAAAFALSESLVLVNPAGNRVHLLDPAARSIYQALAAGLSQDEVTAAIVDADPAGRNRQQIQTELDLLLDNWRREGLVTDVALNGVGDVATAGNQSGCGNSHPGNGIVVPQIPDAAEAKQAALKRQRKKGSFYKEADFRLHDLIFRIKSEDAVSWQAVLSLYSHIRAEPGTGVAETVFSLRRDSEKSYTLVRDDRELTNANSRDTVILALSGEIADLWHRQRDWMMVAHAAAVARNTDCFLLPGSGGSGKTTLAAALLCHGFTALADDIVPLCRNSGNGVALPLCMNIKQPSVALLRRWYPEIDTLHPYEWGSTFLRFLPPPQFSQEKSDLTRTITRIIFPRYKAGASTSLTPISATEAFQRLIEAECMLGNPIDPDKIADLVQWIQQRPSCALVYDSLDEAVDIIAQL